MEIMGVTEVLMSIGGVVISSMGYFLKSALTEIKEIKKIAHDNTVDIEVIKNDYMNKVDSINQKIDVLYQSIDKLTDKIDKLNGNING